jgi:hypothetical protein
VKNPTDLCIFLRFDMDDFTISAPADPDVILVLDMMRDPKPPPAPQILAGENVGPHLDSISTSEPTS